MSTKTEPTMAEVFNGPLTSKGRSICDVFGDMLCNRVSAEEAEAIVRCVNGYDEARKCVEFVAGLNVRQHEDYLVQLILSARKLVGDG